MDEKSAGNVQVGEKGAGRVRIVRFIYGLLATTLFACVFVQVFFAGLGVFVDGDNLDLHRQLAAVMDKIPISMFVLSFFGRIKGRLRWFSLGLYALHILQFITVGPLIGVWVLGAFHAVNALFIFWGALFLMKRSSSWLLLRKEQVL